MKWGKHSWHLDRRTFLRGSGVALGLPLLEGMMPSWTYAATQTFQAPQRAVFMVYPHGCDPTGWSDQSAFKDSLSLIPQRTILVNINNLFKQGANRHSHISSWAGVLTGTGTHDNVSIAKSSQSIDHLIASRLQGQTKFGALRFQGPWLFRGGKSSDMNHSPAYGNTCSWDQSGNPISNMIDPVAAFNTIIGGSRSAMMPTPRVDEKLIARRSILDAILESSKQLQQKVGANDKRKIDEYLEEVRALEQKVEATLAVPPASTLCPLPANQSSINGTPYERTIKLYNEITALAFKCDLSRVAVIQMEASAGGQPEAHYGVSNMLDANLHNESHETWVTAGKPNKPARVLLKQVMTKRVNLASDLAQKLMGIQENGKSGLDNSIVFMTSDQSYAHGTRGLPSFFYGSLGGKFKNGSSINVNGAGLTDFYLTILKALGFNDSKFSNSTRLLTELLK